MTRLRSPSTRRAWRGHNSYEHVDAAVMVPRIWGAAAELGVSSLAWVPPS